jgi:HAD superfamily hydrolase (TIGR01484 family)
MTSSILLCTDLDRTLLPNGHQPESVSARPLFTQLTALPEVKLVFVSGRDETLIKQAIDKFQLPQPDFVISDVGTNIYDLHSGKWEIWPAWHEEIAPDWNGKDREELCELLEGIDELRLQEKKKQNTYKLSYYVPLKADQGLLQQEIRQRLALLRIEADLTWSIDEPASIGLLDILPRSATKLHSVQFLRKRLDYPLNRTLFAGDSGNDLPVLASPIPAVLVANAMNEVKQDALASSKANGCPKALYIAEGGFLGMNGNYSAGILEGVAHYFPDLGQRLEIWLKEGKASCYG